MEVETKKVPSIFENKDHDHNKIDDNPVEILDKEGRYRSESLRLEFESPIFTITRDHFPADIEPLILNSDTSNSNSRDFSLLRSKNINYNLLKLCIEASLYIDQNNATNATEPGTMSIGRSLIQERPNGIQDHLEAKANAYLLYERAS